MVRKKLLEGAAQITLPPPTDQEQRRSTKQRRKKRQRRAVTVPAEADAYTVKGFCDRHGISVPTFYRLNHLMPPTFRIGARVLITKEAAARWRAEREAAATATTQAAE